MKALTHISRGKASMVDVGAKPPTRREAVAFGKITIAPEALALILGANAKGDALAAARIAAIMAAKKTPDFIPLCHAVGLDSVSVSFLPVQDGIVIRSCARAQAKTGVEMEALTAVGVAALVLYDMGKSADRGMTIGLSFLGRKTGGKAAYERPGLPEGWLPGSEKELEWL